MFTWQQALAEYSRTEIATQLRHGAWQRVLRGVYRTAEVDPTGQARVIAAQLSMNVHAAAACHDTAAQLHGFAVLEAPDIHVLCRAARRTRAAGLVVHRAEFHSADVVQVGSVWATTPARTAVDLARTYSRLDAIALLDAALRSGVARSALWAELDRQVGNRGVRQAAALIPLADGRAQSPMESRTRLRCIDAGLPRPEPQLEVRVGNSVRFLDLGWRDHKVGLEFESGEWHTGVAAATRDNPRHNLLVDDGWLMFYAIGSQVYRQPQAFTEPVRRAIVRRELERAVVHGESA